jgi:uncharacterized protein (DUF2236 family)
MQKTMKTQDGNSIEDESKESYQEGKYGRYYEPVMPQSAAIQTIVAEACALGPGAAAVLLQIAAKGVGLGVAAHSSFTIRPVERARRSIVYIFAMVFGTEAEKRVVTDATHRAHSRVKGPGYDANDVDLQLWVAATTYWSLLTGYEEVYGKLDNQVADQVYMEFSVMATGLRVPPEKWPTDQQAFQEYWDKTVLELEITDEARAVAMQVLYPTSHLKNWGLKLFSMLTGPSKRVTTIELLPERVRNELGIPSTLYTRSLYNFLKATNKLIYPLLPGVVRHAPKNYYMKDFRRRVATGSRL